MLFPVLAPRVLGVCFGDILFRIPRFEKTIYLTIDDAPTAGTPEILAALRRHGVPATFFIVSGQIQDRAQIEAILADGHAIGHHMGTTRPGWRLSHEEFVRDFDHGAAVLQTYGPVRFFRPPSGYVTDEDLAHVRAKGFEAILGTAYPFDTNIESVGVLVRLAAWLSVDDGIIILHDGHERGARTAEVLDRLIPLLKARGFTFGELAPAADGGRMNAGR